MTVGKWDAEAWHRQHSSEPRTPRDKKPWVYVAVAAFILTAAGVSATQAFDEPAQIGICHHTGNGFVFLPVAKDGFEHGHHRHHANDYFVSAGSGSCDMLPPAGDDDEDDVEESEEVDETNVTTPVDNVTIDAPDADAGAEAPETPESNETAPEANETAPEPEPVKLGDVKVVQSAQQDDKRAHLHLLITNIGEGNASDVSLVDELPDLRRSWSLSGADSKSCVLNGASLRCWFGDLAPGESVEITLSAYTDRMPCGDAMTNTATVSAVDDAEERNNASSASITARYC